MRVLDLFSGIGGFSLGLERAGMETVAFCEIEEYPRKVLAKHWPDVPIYEDVRDVSKQRLDADGIGRIDVITGGFPCQDISVAGKQAGIEGERSGLWGELARIIGDIRPRYAIVENVTALISGDNGAWFGRVLGDLAEIGYDCEWHCIPASELGANHHRDRVWVICYPQKLQCNGGDDNREHGQCEVSELGDPGSQTDATNADEIRRWKEQESRTECKNTAEPWNDGEKRHVANANQQHVPRSSQFGIFGRGRPKWNELIAGQFRGFRDISEIEPTIRRGADGISDYVHRIKGLGNAVVPQIPELIGRVIMEIEP